MITAILLAAGESKRFLNENKLIKNYRGKVLINHILKSLIISKVQKIIKRKKGINLFIKSNLNLKKKNLGISISCEGVCLTLISIKEKWNN